MIDSSFIFLVLIAPMALLLVAAFSRVESGVACTGVQKGLLTSSYLSMAVALLGAWQVFENGSLESPLIGYAGLGLALRIDSLSILMFGMISILSWVIFRYSNRYLEGDSRHGIFLGRMALTVAAVQLLVLSGNLATLWGAWVATSLALHQLLVFYPQRRKAQMAARKKFIMARIGDLTLGGAFVLIYQAVGSGQLSEVFAAAASATVSTTWEAAGLLLVLAAIFKSAQFPTHSWLVEVMETPTPVSALLHAGLLNAGPFLITRFAMVMDVTQVGPVFLIVISAFTGLFASAAYLTQPSVKTALGYSSIAHMGFSLLTCGLGVYAAAMLHMVAHSFYKAHSFLSSGSVIEQIRTQKVTLPAREGNFYRIILSVAICLGLYLGVAFLLNVQVLSNPALIVVGALVVLGLTQMLNTLLDTRSSRKAVLSGIALVVAVSVAFFTLENGLHYLLENQLPAESIPSTWIQVLMFSVLAVYALAIVLQVLAPTRETSALGRRIGIHLRNGLYVNAWLDRRLGVHKLSAPVTIPGSPSKPQESPKKALEEVSL